MNSTPVSLLQRLRGSSDQDAWQRFVQLYAPLVYHCASRAGLGSEDVNDVVQEVLITLVRRMPGFDYDPTRSFRGWLRVITKNHIRNRLKSLAQRPQLLDGQSLETLASPEDLIAFDDHEYQQHIVQRAMEIMQADFQPTTWKACWEHVVSDRPASEVAQELGITIGAVYAAKFRVLGRLRSELDGLLG